MRLDACRSSWHWPLALNEGMEMHGHLKVVVVPPVDLFLVLVTLICSQNAFPDMRFFSGNTGEALSLRGLRHRLSPSYRDPGTCYARALLLDDNSLLAPWENHGPEPVYFPVFHSTDENKSWQELSKVEDTVNRWGLRYQPTIYKLPRQVGRFPAGTILVAGDAVPPDSSRTKIEIFASTYQA
ncbi:hypothetical protein BKA80DRAFT_77627 [Phyllosticta citrichinensis]